MASGARPVTWLSTCSSAAFVGDLLGDDAERDVGAFISQPQSIAVVNVGARGDGPRHPQQVAARQPRPDQPGVPLDAPTVFAECERHDVIRLQRAEQGRVPFFVEGDLCCTALPDRGAHLRADVDDGGFCLCFAVKIGQVSVADLQAGVGRKLAIHGGIVGLLPGGEKHFGRVVRRRRYASRRGRNVRGWNGCGLWPGAGDERNQ